MTRARRWTAALALVAAAAGPAWAEVTVAGVKYQDSAEVAGGRLALNGAGIRIRLVFKVYAAALYLPRRTASAEEAVAQPGPKRVSLTMLREIDSADFAQAFAKGMADNNDPATLGRLAPAIQRMNQLFADQKTLAPGDGVAIDWVPGTGTVIRIKGGAGGEPFREPEFFPAMLRIWLGPAAVDAALKEALLGKGA